MKRKINFPFAFRLLIRTFVPTMEKLLELYKQWSGAAPLTTEKLPGAGSNREYYRFMAEDGSTVIGCIGTSRDENHAFVYLAHGRDVAVI